MFSKKIVIQGEQFLIDAHMLGSGSQGEVFKIIHVQTGIVYAVKIVRVEDAVAKEAMAHQISILKLISSPFIISILPYSIISDRFSYMIMDYCEAGDLKHHYRMMCKSLKGVEEKHIKKLVYDCTQGYKELEKHKILHMDIKLENILIKAGNYALSDFGLAINMNSNMRRYGGSMLYLSPSRFIKGHEVCPADDMFAFGIVVCEFANDLVHPYYATQVLKGAGKKEKQSVMQFLYNKLMNTKAILPNALSSELLELVERMIQRKQSVRLTWKELYNIVDHSPLFEDVREAILNQSIHLKMPAVSEEQGTEYKQVRESYVRVNLLNSKYQMEEPKIVKEIYNQVRDILRSKMKICIFLARVFDVIQAYNIKDSSNMFKEIQSSMLSIIEQLIDLEGIRSIQLAKVVNAPECIQIQIDKIQQEFDLILAMKNKVGLMRHYFKLQNMCQGFSTDLLYEVHHLSLKVGDMLKSIELTQNMKEIKEDHTVQTALFKLVLYLLDQIHKILRQSDWKMQAKAVPELGKYDLQLRNYGSPQLAKAVNQYIAEDGTYFISIVQNDGCHEIIDDFEILQPPAELIQLNTLGTYPPLY